MNNGKDGFIPDSAIFNRRDFALAVSTTAAGAATAALLFSGSAGAGAEAASLAFTNLNLSYRIRQLTSGQAEGDDPTGRAYAVGVRLKL